MPTRLSKFARLLLLILVAASVLSACGQKGALYLPDEAAQEEEEKRD
jgi:predicted small lipoprotein YifL